jgi:ferritin-like protein
MNEINIKEIKKKLKKQVRLHFNLLVKKIESFDRQKLVFY